ncbi:hypothetical protein BD311DRAFT_423068 [Dichomitus squalens]|uniref:Fungal-type protein kinase domain-containing protein n=1 Tax=Dichomitus squalens TaxID=114155 RepID=A0A4Q9MH47_9APHY|nr:hypothetical protein BD311DRAFT_423068 [Dichomitus squalens]
MVRNMHGDLTWLSLSDFVNNLLPTPQPLLSNFPPEQMSKINASLKDVIQNHNKRSNNSDRLPEDQLASDFADVINKHLLDYCVRSITPIIPVDSVSATPSSQQMWQTEMADKVPRYVMRLSPRLWDPRDDDRNVSDAALFRKDAELGKGRPNWQHQRAFFQFKQEGMHNDPFDEAQEGEAEALEERKKVWGQLSAYADQVFLYQHRAAAFSLFVIGREFRVMQWDRIGVFVSEKVDYLLRTDALVEVLLALIVMDDEGQGFDTSATLIQKGSDDYRLMDTLADVNIPFHLPVVGYEEGTPLPETLFAAPSQPLPTNTNTVMNGPSPGLVDRDTEQPTTLHIPDGGSFVFEYVLDYFRKSLTDWPRYNLTIDDDEFLVCKPFYHTRGVFGRGTRGYVAYRKRTSTFVFLKDIWRPVHENVNSEAQILNRLNKDGVCNVPTLLTTQQFDYSLSPDCKSEDPSKNEDSQTGAREGRSDEPHGVKRTHSEMEEEPTPDVWPYVHHRLAFKEVCLPLKAFQSSRQLVSVIRDAVEAHYEATSKSRVMHCDISSGNILILPTFIVSDDDDGNRVVCIRWRGILADWELSKPVSEPEQDVSSQKPEHEIKVGTWRYMSVASLLDALHTVSTADEIESFFNVLLENAIRYCSHNMELYATAFINDYFVRFWRLPDGTLLCPAVRCHLMTFGDVISYHCIKLEFGLDGRPNKALNILFATFLGWFKARYDVRQYEKSLSKQKTPSSTTDAAAESEPPARRRRFRFVEPKTGSPFPGRTVRKRQAVSGPIPPSEETYKEAANLQDHDAVRNLFWAVLNSGAEECEWPENEVLRDHLHVPSPPEQETEESVHEPRSTAKVPATTAPVFQTACAKTTRRRAATASGRLLTKAWGRK